MPDITLTFTDTQATRIDEALALENAATGQSLTRKQFILRLIRQRVRKILFGEAMRIAREQEEADLAAAAQAKIAALEADGI